MMICFSIFFFFQVSAPNQHQNFYKTEQFHGEWWTILDQNSLISIPYPRLNCLKTLPFTAAHTYIAYGSTLPPAGGGESAQSS